MSAFAALPFAGPPFAETSDGAGGASLVATLPAITADLSSVALGGGMAVAVLPALTATVVGEAPAAVVFATATLPALTAVVEGVVYATAAMLASLPALTATVSIVTGQRRPLRSWQACPRPASGFAMSGRVGSLRTGEADL